MPILIIDGVDECDDNNEGIDTQRRIITLISKLILEFNIPIRFMVASPPEFWIQDLFATSLLSKITCSRSLQDNFTADGVRFYNLFDG